MEREEREGMEEREGEKKRWMKGRTKYMYMYVHALPLYKTVYMFIYMFLCT